MEEISDYLLNVLLTRTSRNDSRAQREVRVRLRRDYANVRQFRDALRNEQERRGRGVTSYPRKVSDIPDYVWRELDFNNSREMNKFIREKGIRLSAFKSVRELLDEIREKLIEVQKEQYKFNITAGEMTEEIERLMEDGRSFEMNLSGLNFAENLALYRNFKDGIRSPAWNKFKTDFDNEGLVLDTYGEVMGQYGDDELIVSVVLFPQGGCLPESVSCHGPKFVTLQGKYRLQILKFRATTKSCLFQCIQWIKPHVSLSTLTHKNIMHPVTQKAGLKIAQKAGIRVHTREDCDCPKKDEIFLENGHYFPIVNVTDAKEYSKKVSMRMKKIHDTRRGGAMIKKENMESSRSLLFYDIETTAFGDDFVYKSKGVMNKGNPLRARVLCIYYCNNIMVEEDQQIWSSEVFYGYDCADQFLLWLRLRVKFHYNVYAHNGSRFDHWFVVPRMGDLENRKIQLSGKDITGCQYYNHTFKDTCKILPVPLAQLARDFDTTPKKSKYESLGLTSYQLCNLPDDQMVGDKKSAYIDYCMSDCIVLKEVFMKFRKVIREVDRYVEPILIRTTGSLAKRILQPDKKRREWIEKFIDNDPEKYQFVKRSIYGGISYSRANRYNKPQMTTDSVAGVDINSHYPASMLYSMYPAGESRWETDRDKCLSAVQGFLEIKDIKFDEQDRMHMIPRHQDGRIQWWHHDDYMKESVVVNTDFLKYLRERDGLKSFTVVKGLICSQAANGYTMYGEKFNKLYGIKKEQDQYGEWTEGLILGYDMWNTLGGHDQADPYNPSLRSVIKLILNSYFGKNLENYQKYETIVWNDEETKKTIFGKGYTTEKRADLNNMLVVGSQCLSMSKIIIDQYMKCMPIGSEPFHIETDGFYFEAKYLEEFKSNVENTEVYMTRIMKGFTESKNAPRFFGFNKELGGIKSEGKSLEGHASYTNGKKLYYLAKHKPEEYATKEERFESPSDPRLKAITSDCKISGVPIYHYVNGLYQVVVSPWDFKKMYENNKKPVNFRWNKLTRDMSKLMIAQIVQERERGYIGG